MELRSVQSVVDTQTVNTDLKLQHVILVVGHLQMEGVHGCRGQRVSIKRGLQGDDRRGPV